MEQQDNEITDSGGDELIWRGEVSNELRHLSASVRELRGAVSALHAWLEEELLQHREYHKENEHRWGLTRWCQLHPFRMAALLGALATTLLAGETAPRWVALAKTLCGIVK